MKVLYVAARELIPVADYLRLYQRDALSAVAKIAATVNFPVTTADGTQQRILRTLLVINDETPVVASERSGNNRHNAYPLPGALQRLVDGKVLQSLHCRNVGNPQIVPVLGTVSQPCEEAPPLKFRGQLRSYPHVELAGP